MRYFILEKITTENGIDIFDPTSVNWSKFPFDNNFKVHVLKASDILKPYMISFVYFDTVDYEDIILLINGIENVFDLLPGTEIKIPMIEDLENFILENK